MDFRFLFTPRFCFAGPVDEFHRSNDGADNHHLAHNPTRPRSRQARRRIKTTRRCWGRPSQLSAGSCRHQLMWPNNKLRLDTAVLTGGALLQRFRSLFFAALDAGLGHHHQQAGQPARSSTQPPAGPLGQYRARSRLRCHEKPGGPSKHDLGRLKSRCCSIGGNQDAGRACIQGSHCHWGGGHLGFEGRPVAAANHCSNTTPTLNTSTSGSLHVLGPLRHHIATIWRTRIVQPGQRPLVRGRGGRGKGMREMGEVGFRRVHWSRRRRTKLLVLKIPGERAGIRLCVTALHRSPLAMFDEATRLVKSWAI